MENLAIEDHFGGVFAGRRVLVTGHNGFKGSWLSLWLSQLGAKVIGFSLKDYQNSEHWDSIKSPLNITEEHGDVRSFDRVLDVIHKHQPEILFHLAAQSLVRDSYDDPLGTIQTNVMGTANVLESVRIVGGLQAAVIVTTDKVYANQEWNWPYRESDRLSGHDPYSSSKVCTEEVVNTYKKSFFDNGGPAVATARAGNVIGGGDWSKDRLVPDIIRVIKEQKGLQIRNPEAVRPWQHVLDSISGYLLLGQTLLEGNRNMATSWNFGPDHRSCVDVRTVLHAFAEVLSMSDITFVAKDETKHESQLLSLDTSKARRLLKWIPIWELDEAIHYTASWYLSALSNSINTHSDLRSYIDKAQAMGVKWIPGA